MELKLFSELIDALGTVVNGLKAIANLSKKEREKIYKTLDETYRLIDTTLNMVIIRVGDILQTTGEDDFLHEAARLDNFGDWIKSEREFRLCRSLRIALRETETIVGKISGRVSIKSWDTLLEQMNAILATENEVALFIGQQFHECANDACNAGQDIRKIKTVRKTLDAFRTALIAEREELIKQELELYKYV
jgi:hypothetical protein